MAFVSWTAGIIALLAGACLLAGFLTNVFGVVVAAEVAATFSWLQASSPRGMVGVLPAITVIVVAIAVSLLGPGAYSVDARLFGMREIVITRAGAAEAQHERKR